MVSLLLYGKKGMKILLNLNNMAKRNYWTKHEERVLSIVYANATREELEAIFKRAPNSIYQKAFVLGLKKTSKVISTQISESMRNNKKKGNINVNTNGEN